MKSSPPKKPASESGDDPFVRFFRRAPKQSRSRAVVEAVVIALEEQLAHTDDPNAWTLEALVERAGIGIGSFYEYFPNRDSLLGVLIGKVTERNFRSLLQAIDEKCDATLDDLLRTTSRATATAYLQKPAMLRVILSGVARLGLHTHIVRERDRFATELSSRAARFFPGVQRDELDCAMRTIADASMGIIVADVTRTETPDIDLNARRIECIARATLDALESS